MSDETLHVNIEGLGSMDHSISMISAGLSDLCCELGSATYGSNLVGAIQSMAGAQADIATALGRIADALEKE